jgi:LysM repeat protein
MKQFILILFLAVALSLSVAAQTSNAVEQYINTYKELANKEEIRASVPAAITLAQGILESEAGQSELSIASNNHFGIKCKSEWTGASVYHDDDIKNECFRSYPTVEDSYRDHSDFLKSRPNYSFLFNLDPADYTSWAYGLKRAGYATNPDYAGLLIKIINDNNLEDYTLIALERIKNGIQQDFAGNDQSPAGKHVGSSDEAVNNEAQPAVDIEVIDGSYPQGEFTINQTKVIYANTGTSLFALANNYDIAYKKLLEFNNLDNNVDILQKDQLIYLAKKPKKSISKDYHIVAASETIEEIAQKEGVQLESLYEYNKMQKGLQPAPGEKVYLRPGTPSYFPKLLARNSRK